MENKNANEKDIEKNATTVTETEFPDDRSDKSAPRSRRKRLVRTFMRRLDPNIVGRKKALWTRCLILLVILTVAFGIACL
jgi:hypothetical protein